MARLARLCIPGHPHHVILRAAPGVVLFRASDDYRQFLHCLREAAQRSQVAVHSYLLMPDCVHLLVTPAAQASMGQAIQSLGRRYVRWFNGRYGRRGSLWEGRYRSSLVEAAQYLLDCSVYIETIPAREGLVSEASSYPWSSLRHHLGLVTEPLITDHPIVWALGNTPFERQSAYRRLAEHPLEPERVERLEWASKRGWAVGSANFLSELGAVCGRPLSPRARGRKRITTSSTPTLKLPHRH